MSDIAIPIRANLILASGIALSFLAILILLPAFGAPWPVMLIVTLLLIPFNTPLWSLIHEAIHKNFNSRKRLNEDAGRFMGIIYGASFGVLRFGHLMHHQYNRDWENEYYTGSKLKASVHHYFQMLGGLYLTEVLLSLVVTICPAPVTRKVARVLFDDDRHYEATLNSLLKPANVRQIRIDFILIALLYTGIFTLFGAYWFVPLIALLGRGVIISIMDNAYHYGTPQDNSVMAKELRAPAWYEKFILNFNHHLTHHKNVRLPWNALAEHQTLQENEFAEDLGSAVIAQFKGPIKSNQ